MNNTTARINAFINSADNNGCGRDGRSRSSFWHLTTSQNTLTTCCKHQNRSRQVRNMLPQKALSTRYVLHDTIKSRDTRIKVEQLTKPLVVGLQYQTCSRTPHLISTLCKSSPSVCRSWCKLLCFRSSMCHIDHESQSVNLRVYLNAARLDVWDHGAPVQRRFDGNDVAPSWQSVHWYAAHKWGYNVICVQRHCICALVIIENTALQRMRERKHLRKHETNEHSGHNENQISAWENIVQQIAFLAWTARYDVQDNAARVLLRLDWCITAPRIVPLNTPHGAWCACVRLCIKWYYGPAHQSSKRVRCVSPEPSQN